MKVENENESKVFYVIRGFAILSVVYAHSLNLSDPCLSRVGTLLGIIGVPLFLISSGYYFQKTPIDTLFFLKKFKTLISPWLIWGTIAYVLTIISSRVECSFFNYILYLLGCYTWLYYVPIFIVILFLFNLIKIDNKSILFLILLSLLSNVITDNFFYSSEYFTSYQNPLNWIIFFAIGIWLKQENFLYYLSSRIRLFAFLISSLALIILIFVEKICYWNLVCISFELISFGFFYAISFKFSDKLKVLEILGRKSYILYFLHMQFGIYFTNRLLDTFCLQNEFLLLFLKPLIVVLITLFIVYFLETILNRGKLGNLNVFLGLGK